MAGSFMVLQKSEGGYEMFNHFAEPGSFPAAKATPLEAIQDRINGKVSELAEVVDELKQLNSLLVDTVMKESTT